MASKNVIMQGGGAGLQNNNPMGDMMKPERSMAATMISDVTMQPIESPPGLMAPIIEDSSEPTRLNKRVNVTVTILSIAGLFVKDGAAKKKGGLMSKKFPSRSSSHSKSSGDENNGTAENSSLSASLRSNDDTGRSTASPASNTSSKSTSSATPTTIVASFSRMVKTREGKPKTVMTHVPSMPLPLPEGKKAVNSVVRWPEQKPHDIADANDNGEDGINNLANRGQVLSSYQFQRTFKREDSTTSTAVMSNKDMEDHFKYSSTIDRFVPQPLSIQIAISRSGRMFKLGTANILLSGEENGGSSINVPIKNCNPAIPKSNKLKGVLGTSSSNSEKMIPMMKLKGDTLKCGLAPNATLRVLVHVSEPIGETVEISPKFNVTMISNSMKNNSSNKPRLPPQPQQRPRPDRPVAPSLSLNGIPSAISWEYNPTLAAVVVKTPGSDAVDDDRDGDEPLLRVFSSHHEDETHNDDEDYEDEDYTVDDDDEPSCTSSAYMSVAMDDRYPSKNRSGGHDLTTSRSYTTATTMTSLSSAVSDLTDGHSWLSQTGIEVIPFAPNMADLPVNSRLRCLEEGDSLAGGAAAVASGDNAASRKSDIIGASPDGKQRSPTVPAVQTWRQRLACGFVPVCGGSGGGGEGGVGSAADSYDTLSTVNEENVISTNRYSLVGRCTDGAIGEHFGHHPSYYTEVTGGTSFIDEEDELSDDSSEESSVM